MNDSWRKDVRAVASIVLTGLLLTGFAAFFGCDGDDGGAGKDTTPPMFNGLATAEGGEAQVTLTWYGAFEELEPVTYFVYMATASMAQDFDAPDAETGTLDYVMTGLEPGVRYYFVVRAEDEQGNMDDNRHERSAIPHDGRAPLFVGLDCAIGHNRFIDLGWGAAIDATRPISYNIYQFQADRARDFSTPIATTQDRTYRAQGLANGDEYCYVVRAEDAGGLEETNTGERCALPTPLSFVPDAAEPDPGTMSLQLGAIAGNRLTVEVVLRSPAQVYGISFRLAFDTARLTFIGIEGGAGLRPGSDELLVKAVEKPAGTVIAGVSRTGTIEGLAFDPAGVVARLTFEAEGTGGTALSFIDGKCDVIDSLLNRVEIDAWHGGTVDVAE